MTTPHIKDDAVYLIDGSGYIFRAYFAVRSLSSKSGVPTNAVFGFTNMLLKLIKDRNPKYLSIAFDTKEKNFRHHLYSEYKAHRPPPPEDLIPQFALIHRLVDALSINRLIKVGYEADDLLGSAAKIAKKSGKQVVIVTGDKDLMQLVDDRVFLLDELRATKTGAEEIVDAEGVEQKFGVPPKYVADVLALAGDTSDNVPGVKGIGGKTASSLILEYEGLDRLLKNAANIAQKGRREKLMAGIEDAKLSKQLVDIDCDVEMGITTEDLLWKKPDGKDLYELFDELDFNRLKKDEGLARILGHASNSLEERFPGSSASKYRSVTTNQELDEMLGVLSRATHIAVDTETDGLDVMQAKLVGISLSTQADRGWYIPVAHDLSMVPDQIPLGDIILGLDPILMDKGKVIIAQNAKFDLKMLVQAGFSAWKIGEDPMLANYLLKADQMRHGLDVMADHYLGVRPIPFEEVCGKGRNKITFDQVPLDKATEYAAEDADLTYQLAQILSEDIQKAAMEKLYHGLELPLSEVLARMEMTGVKVDVQFLKQMSVEFVKKLDGLEQKAYQVAGSPFNLASPKQVGEILFDKLGLDPVKKTKTGFSTDSSVLEVLAFQHELPGLILEHRMISKLKGTYVDALPQLVNPKTGRVHTTFNQFVAATGRLSSSDPNLQNIPIRTPEGRRIREAFIPEEGNLFAALDYSQIELRLLAHVSKDPVMVDSFQKGEDVHQRTASEIFGLTIQDVTKEQRSHAKTINFGLLYGMGVHRLSQTLGIPRKEAQNYLDAYYHRYRGIFAWQEKVLSDARESGEVRTLLGRRRSVPDINSANRMLSTRAERVAINTPIQGTAADMIKKAMIEVDRALTSKYPNTRMLLQVHDELILEGPKAEIQAASKLVQEIMENVFDLLVPIVVDCGIADSWAKAH